MKIYKIKDADFKKADTFNLLQLATNAEFDYEEFDNISELKVGDKLSFDNGTITVERIK